MSVEQVFVVRCDHCKGVSVPLDTRLQADAEQELWRKESGTGDTLCAKCRDPKRRAVISQEIARLLAGKKAGKRKPPAGS